MHEEYQIMVMNSDGSNKQVLFKDVPKGMYIEDVFSDETRFLGIQWANDYHTSTIGIYDIQNNVFNNLTPGLADAHNANVSISMDESIIVFTSTKIESYEGDIYMMDANGNNLTNLTEDIENSYTPQVSPDGHYIIFQSYSGSADSGQNGIYVFDVASLSLNLAVPNDSCVYHIETFSDTNIPTNGSEFVFEYRCRNKNIQIGIASMDGTVKKVFNLDGIDITARVPIISPDGEWIIFSGYSINGVDIYRISRNGTHLKNLTENSIDGDWFTEFYFIYD